MSDAPHSEQVVDPSQCAALFAIPLAREVFLRNLAVDNGYIAEVAAEAGWSLRTGASAWTIYSRSIAEPVLACIRAVRRHRTKVVEGGTLSELKSLCQSFKVVTIFAHCDDSSDRTTVEFADEAVPIQDVARSVPAEFDGVLDLALCHSWRLGEELKRVIPNLLVTMNAKRVRPVFRARFYQGTIDYLVLRPQRYTDAVIDLAKELIV